MPSSSPRWRSRRTTRSASRSSRSCARACSRRGSARRPASTTRCATTAYWVALLRYVGCTGHAHEVATLFGDEIAIRAQTLVHDAGNPAEVMGDVIEYATAGRPRRSATQIITMLQETAPRVGGAQLRARAARWPTCSSQRLDFGPGVREALAFTFERWNGKGFPTHTGGEAIPLPMRVVHVSHDMEAIGRLFSPERALEAARERRDQHLRPGARRRVRRARAAGGSTGSSELEPWDAVLALEPEPRRDAGGRRRSTTRSSSRPTSST